MIRQRPEERNVRMNPLRSIPVLLLPVATAVAATDPAGKRVRCAVDRRDLPAFDKSVVNHPTGKIDQQEKRA